MSLFAYNGRLVDGKGKTGKVTAKSEKAARDRIANEHKVAEILSIKPLAEPSRPTKTATQSAPKPNTPKTKALSKLQRMLYLQHGRCFFCGEELHESEASIEHLNPKSNGGKSTEDNEVVCHVSLNQTFGSMDLKRKFEFVLRQAGTFRCPAVRK
jgi:hypothetical protein